MADALCGPSNALQSFQKHTSVDRTLQQDRLISRQPPAQGFRSSPSPNAGILDPEFEAFQAGFSPGLPQAELQSFHPQRSFQAPPQISGWAADFQRLQISHPPPQPLQQPRFAPQSPATQNSAPSWHQAFLQQHPVQSASLTQNVSYNPFTPASADYRVQSPHMMYSGNVNGSYLSPTAQGKQREEHVLEEFDDSAFERAFEEAHAEILQENTVVEDTSRAEPSTKTQTDHLAAQEELDAKDQQVFRDVIGMVSRQGSQAMDTVQHSEAEENFFDILAREEAQQRELEAEEAKEQQQQQRQAQDDGDELAQTAGQLLESVSSNTSKKFQESNFLALMRKLRDREVRVEGDKVVETHSSTPHIPSDEQDADLGREPTMTGAIMNDMDHHNNSWSPAEDGSQDIGGLSPQYPWSYFKDHVGRSDQWRS